MRVRLKGINRTKKRLKESGSIVVYYYAWKGGPPLVGLPDTPEFIASYQDAWKRRIAVEDNGHLFKGLAEDYMASSYFNKKLKPHVQGRNAKIINDIVRQFGELELDVFDLDDIESDIEDWYEAMYDRSPSTASRYLSQLSAVLKWGVRRGRLKRNVASMVMDRYVGSRVDIIWTEADEAAFLARVPAYLHLAFVLAIWTGQREGDLVMLKWSQYDGEWITIVQEKGRLGRPARTVRIYVSKVLKGWLDAAKTARGIKPEDEATSFVLLTSRGKPWGNKGSFATKFSMATDDARIENRTYHDLRRTAITRLFRAGCKVPQIAVITGHSLKTVQDVIDRHYFHRDAEMGKEAILLREAYEERDRLPTALPTGVLA